MQPLSTSPSCRSHRAASLTLSKKIAALAGRPETSRGREGQAFQSQPVRDTRLRRQNHCFSPSANQLVLQEGPSGSRPHTRWSQLGQGLQQPLHLWTGCWLLPRWPTGTPAQCQPLPGAQPVSVGQSRGHAGIHPSGAQLPLPSSRAELTPAPLPCRHSPDWEPSTAQLG